MRHMTTCSPLAVCLEGALVLLLLWAGALPAGAQERPKIEPVYLGDPYIMKRGNTYYLYGTMDSDTGIKVYKSTDLREWRGPAGAQNGFALHADDVYGEGSYWAPEVYHLKDRYYMFFSVEEHIAVATSTYPEGPFTQKEEIPLREHKSIDPHLFVDSDSTKYIYFANFKDGLEIWGAEMKDDLLSIKEETLTLLLQQSQAWERSREEPGGTVNEGPFVIKHNDRYYMTYSANHYASRDYGIGLARADHPLGEWTKHSQNPVMQTPDSLVGTGHNALFRNQKGQLHMVYHAHHDRGRVHPRRVIINPVKFRKIKGARYETLEVLSPGIKPVISSREEEIEEY